jgi:lipoprotein-releasing system permease protein
LRARLVFSIAFRQLFSRSHSLFIRTVSVLSVAGIAIGVSALILLQAFMGGFHSSIRQYLAALNPPLIIRAPGGMMLDADDLALVAGMAEEIEGVTTVSPFIEKTAVAAGRNGEVAGVVVRGVVWETEQRITGVGSGGTPDGAIVGTLLALRLGVSTGDTIRLASTETATVSGAGRILVDTIIPVRIASVIDMGLEEYNKTLVFTDITMARALFRSAGFATSIGAGMEEGSNPLAAAEEINTRLRNEYVNARHPSYLSCDAFITYHGNLFRALGLEKMAMTIVLALITVVALLNLSSAISMISIEHRRDFGVLRAMGASPGTILGTTIVQGGVIGMAGAVAGVVFSGVAVYLINNFFPIRLETSVYWIDMLPGRFNPGTAALICILTVGACLVSSLIPGMKALAKSPAEAVRYE